MSRMVPQDVWIGADPGGKCKFGLAIIQGDSAQTLCVSSVVEAVDVLLQKELLPTGVGIDAPLWWSAGPAGNRLADLWIRKEYALGSNNVQSVNSMWGAVLVQGVMFVEQLRLHFPHVRVTEAHPKAVLKHFEGGWPEFALLYGLQEAVTNEHERDALIAAVAAREGFSQRWPRDLSEERALEEQDPQNHWIGPVHYWWPG